MAQNAIHYSPSHAMRKEVAQSVRDMYQALSEEEAKAIFCDLAGKGSDIQLWHFAKGTTIESGTKSSVDDGEQESSKSVQTKPSGQPKTSA